MNSIIRKVSQVAIVTSVAMSLFACGGGGGGGGAASQKLTVAGTASQGAAVAEGTTVDLTDSEGHAVSSMVGSNGAYSVDVTNLKAPYVLKVGAMYSYAEHDGTTTNINPFTTLAVQLAENSATVSTTLPTDFSSRYTSAVGSLKTALNGLYPANVTASTDFANGNLTLGEGVDRIFDTTQIIPPDASGNYVVNIAGQPTITGNSKSSITATVDNSVIAKVTAAIFGDSRSGFSALTMPGQTFTVTSYDKSTTRQYDFGLTGNSVTTGGHDATWSVNGNGSITLHAGTDNITFTILEKSATVLNSYTVQTTHSSTPGVVEGPDTLVFAPTFNSSILAGHTWSLSTAGGVRTLVFAATGNTMTINGTDGIWSVSNGMLTVAGGGDSMTFTVATGIGQTFVVTYVHASSPASIEGPDSMTITK